MRMWTNVVMVGWLAAVSGCSSCTPNVVNTDDGEARVTPPLVRCVQDGDCTPGQLCVGDYCRVACADDSACSGSRPLCNTVDGVCQACLTSGDCDGDAVCDVDGECAAATNALCAPYAVGCVDERTAFLCDADGASQQQLPCREDQICRDGACVVQTCAPASTTCVGNAVATCNADGTQSELSTCTTCPDEGAFGCSCDAGACSSRVCEPSAGRCVGNGAQRCDAVGLAFSALEDCGQNSCVAGRCLADNCTPGATLCSGTLLLTCGDDGAGFLQSQCPQSCAGADGSATCVDRVCEPLAQHCADDATLEICNGSGSAVVAQPCGEGRACSGDQCVNQACTPLSVSCVGDSVATCRADGSQTDVVACASTDSCVDGACVPANCTPACGARTCGPDPLCGTSCGACAGSCSNAGVCAAPQGPLMEVVLSWTPTSQDLDLSLARAGNSLCSLDSCNFTTCQTTSSVRAEWDGVLGVSAGDPLLDVADAASSNPEIIVVTLPDGAENYRVGAHNFGPRANQAAASASATITVRVDGDTINTFTHTIATKHRFSGVTLAWTGSTMTMQNGTTDEEFVDCLTGTGSGNSCFVDLDCPSGEGCVGGLLNPLTCQDVACSADTDCTNQQRCTGAHTCVSTSVGGWKASCQNSTDCLAGFRCSFLTQVCEELCDSTLVSCSPDNGCCPSSGSTSCVLLIGSATCE